MTDLTTTITLNDTDHTITINNEKPRPNEDTITKHGYIHYNQEFDVYMLISYKTGMGQLLDHTVHQIGTKPSLNQIPKDSLNYEKIRERIETELDYHPDDERDITYTVFSAIRDNSPGEHEYPAQLQFGDIDAWQVRALELYQSSVLANKPQLCKVQALREAGHRPFEISNILDTHKSTISHQLNDIDTWLDKADWTTQHVTND